jgi:Zn-finger nucleic acid-binding protein
MPLCCPLCRIELVRLTYEGFGVTQCGSCRGVLVLEGRVGGIKARRERSIEQLGVEIENSSAEDTRTSVPCPSCSHAMYKHSINRPHRFSIDRCDKCHLVWLDGGELAKLQLAFEDSGAGEEASELKRRWDEMSPERRAEFERNLAKLPNPPNPVLLGILDAIKEAPFKGRRYGRFRRTFS